MEKAEKRRLYESGYEIMKRSIPLRQVERELLRNPECAREYLKISSEETRKDGNRAAFLRAFRTVVDARGGVVNLAEEGNPSLDTLNMILSDLGLQLTVEAVAQREG